MAATGDLASAQQQQRKLKVSSLLHDCSVVNKNTQKLQVVSSEFRKRIALKLKIIMHSRINFTFLWTCSLSFALNATTVCHWRPPNSMPSSSFKEQQQVHLWQKYTKLLHFSTLKNYKHWDSAYLRQGISYQCRYLANQYEWMSVNHFLCLPIVTNLENNPCTQAVNRIATKI